MACLVARCLAGLGAGFTRLIVADTIGDTGCRRPEGALIAGWEAGWRDGWAVWSSYRPSDFLMFAPQTYLRLFELAHAEGWPWAHAGAALLGLVLLGCTLPRSRRSARPWRLALACAVLGAAWIVAGAGFIGRHFASIHWAGPGVALAFMLQGALLLALATSRAVAARAGQAPAPADRSPAPRPDPGPEAPRRARVVGTTLLVAGVAAYPWLAPLLQRPWPQAELFALMPDPTVLATLGLLPQLQPAAVPRPAGANRWSLPAALGGLAWPIPLAVALLQAVTLWTLGWPALAMLLPAAALLACWAARR